MYKFCCFCFLFLRIFVFTVNFQDFDQYQNKIKYEDINYKLNKFLIKDSNLQDFFTLTENAFILFDSPESKKLNKEEYRLNFGQESLRAKKWPSKLKIAIDPGHFGGKYAQLEDRFISITHEAMRVTFDEGTLSFLTAIYLKELLEKEGHEVLLTRHHIGSGALKENFYEWLKQNPELDKKGESLNKLFRNAYNPLDLKARAKLINDYKPDLTVIIHYNAHSDEKENSRTQTTELNFNLVFVPGAFCTNELNAIENRYEFLRLLVTSDLFYSQAFSEQVIDNFTKELRVPSVDDNQGIKYLTNRCLKISPGVYSRNLALTRLVHSPLCYGESLIQNNIQESKRLGTYDTKIANHPCSSRLKEVAQAYFKAIQNFQSELFNKIYE